MKAPETKEELATIIDYTLLKLDATTAAIKDLCKEALKEHFYSVCVNPCYIELCKDELKIVVSKFAR
jgi:Deoxyribose-phosphate aldolase